MTPKQPFELIYDPEVAQHLKAIDRKYRSLIRRTIEEQLSYEPEIETRNRKPLRRPSKLGTAWEIRFGPDNRFRVFYPETMSRWAGYRHQKWPTGGRSAFSSGR